MNLKHNVEENREQFLDHVRCMVEYWNDLPDKSTKDRIEGMAFSILAAMDGGSEVGPYALMPVLNDDGDLGDDIAGCLHELFLKKK